MDPFKYKIAGCIAGAGIPSWISKGPGDNVTVIGMPECWFSRSAKQHRNPCCRPPSVYQDLSTSHDWPVEKSIVILPIRLKENSKRISGNSLSPLGAQSQDIGATYPG